MSTPNIDTCVKDELEIFKQNKNGYVPRLLNNGETLLTAMIKVNYENVSDMLIEADNGHHFLIIKNSEGKLPIFLAIEKENWQIVQSIVYDTFSLDVKDGNDKLPISYMFDKLNTKLEAKQKSEKKDEQEVKQISTKKAKQTPQQEDEQKAEDEIRDIVITIKLMIYRGADITDFLMSVVDRKIRRDLKEFFLKLTVEYEIEEIDILMCSCKKTSAECVINCGHIFCYACVENFEECPQCFETKPFKPLRIYQA